ncbi:hypothetical protein ACFC6U_39750 [Kitasatospora purpeofusca]|uniref:hypothetical protein n=1 Tax=Kitasatospora purpeofusca TaxID=67352 RepID=UPI0035D5E2CF
MTDVQANHVRNPSPPQDGRSPGGGQPAANGRPAVRPQGLHPGVWVTQAYPPVLAAALQRRGGIPVAVREAVLDQLGHRSPATLRERIERRWWARWSHLPAGEIAERADDIAYALVAEPGCPEPRCEDGWLLDTDHGCPRCRQRTVDTAAVAPAGPPAARTTVAAAAAAIRQTILTSRTAAHHRQARHDQRAQQHDPRPPHDRPDGNVPQAAQPERPSTSRSPGGNA